MIVYVYNKNTNIIIQKINNYICIQGNKVVGKNESCIMGDLYTYYLSENDTLNVNDDISSLILQDAKDKKIAELNSICSSEIEKGFWSNALSEKHLYRFNKDEDQPNFTQQILLLQLNPSIESVIWKVEDVGYLQHTKAQFLQVVNDIATGKQELINKYWGYKNKVLSCNSVDEVNNISWEYNTEVN